MRHRVPYGFTLIELLIVVTIIGILLALIGPAINTAWRAADDHRCTTNLHYLSQAIALRRADAAEGVKPEVKPRSWPAQLLPYLEYNPMSFICPLAGAATSEAGTEEDLIGDSRWGGTGGRTPLEDEGSGSRVPLTELIELRLGGSNAYQPMEAGVWTIKLSEEQYLQARSMGYLGPDGPARLRDRMDTTYRRGANPLVYYLGFEDAISTGGDQDFNDTVIRVQDRRNGIYNLTISGHTAGAHKIVNKTDHQVLLALPTGNYYEGLAAQVGKEETPEPGPGSGGTGSGGGGGQGTSSVILSVSTNYGMNGDYDYLTSTPGRVELMDYTGYLIHSNDVWTDPKWDPNGDGVPSFARHSGRVNVLMTDGSVRLMDPDELDPARPTAYMRYWTP